MGKKTVAPSTKEARPEPFKKTLQGRLEMALDILKDRYTRDFPTFIKALQNYQQALSNLQGAGMKLASELSRVGAIYKNSKYGEAWGRLGQALTEVEGIRAGLVANINAKFVSPMTKSLSNEKKAFASNDKKVKTEIANNEAEIGRLIDELDKEQPAGTDRMLVNLANLSKKVAAFDNRNADMLRDLQASQQQQYISWSEHWHDVVTALLDYHVQMEKKLGTLKPIWQVTGGNEAVASKPSAAAAPAPTPSEQPLSPKGKKSKDKKK